MIITKENLLHLSRALFKPIYKGTRALAAVSAIYAVTEWLAEKEDIKTPYWFILYGSTLIMATALFFLDDHFNNPDRQTHNKGLHIAKKAIHVGTEITEEAILLTLQIEAIHDADNKAASYLLLTGLLVAYLGRSVLLHQVEKFPQGFQSAVRGTNQIIFNPLQFSILLYGFLSNWVIDEFDAKISNGNLALISAGIAFGLTYISHAFEGCLVLGQPNTKRLETYHDTLFRVADFFQSNIFFTRFVANSAVSIAVLNQCEKDCASTVGNYGFYISNYLSIALGIARVMHLEKTKPHRMHPHAANVNADNNERLPLIPHDDTNDNDLETASINSSRVTLRL